jgi:ubiquinone/menaquinone biosynthesis C-methylase UbiE
VTKGIDIIYSKLDACRGCGARIEEPLWQIELAATPMVGKLYQNIGAAAGQPVLPLTWLCCKSCGLLQVAEDVQDSHIYNEYNYSSSSFLGLQPHFDELAHTIDDLLARKPDSTFLEIGCNDGILIKRVTKAGQKIGVDPSDVALKAQDDSYVLHNRFFTKGMDDVLEDESCDVVATSNSFAHFSDIRGAIEEIRRILKPDGTVFVEVHDGDLLLDELQWDTIYHEHKVEWTQYAIGQCFFAGGLFLKNCQKLPMHGGTIRLQFTKTPTESIIKGSTADQLERLEAFSEGYKHRFENEVVDALSKVEKFCCYGASGRAVSWLYQMNLHEKVLCIYDDSSERVGRFVGHSGIEIRSGEYVGEHKVPVVITAWNFARSIRRKHAEKGIAWLQYYT